MNYFKFRKVVFVILIACAFIAPYATAFICSNYFDGIIFIESSDAIAIFGALLAIFLPLAILVIERTGQAKTFIESKTYVKETFSTYLVLYLIFNILPLLSFNQWHFITFLIISILGMVFSYYRIIRLISDPIYFSKKVDQNLESYLAADEKSIKKVGKKHKK